MIQLYTNNNQDISKNGIILNPISCEINPKLNDSNELEMEIMLDDEGLYKNIARGRIITVPTPDFEKDQIYRIYDTKKCMSSNSMLIYARHVFFDLNKKIIFNKNVQGNGKVVLSKLLEDTNFNGTSDSNVTDIRQYKMRNITNVIAGNEVDSFLKIWGGEIECNNFNLNIPLKRGSDKGIRVTFGYNLEDIEEELNADEVVTRIFPYSGDLVLSGSTPYVDSPLIAKYSDVYEQSIEMSDIKVKERTYDSDGNETTSEDAEGYDTRAEAEAEMVKRCERLFSDGADKIKANYKVKMQSLAKTQEYKRLGYDILEKVCLGDVVHCYNKNIDIEVSARCISYKWDCIKQEYIEIELGQFISNYIDENLSELDNLYRKIILEKQYILLRVDSMDNTLHSEIKITEDKIHSEVVDTKKGLESQITQTAGEIRSEVTDKTNQLSSTISQTASQIRSEVSNTASGLQSQITQQAGQIQSTVTGLNNTNSQITQLNNQISSKVSENEISSLIEQNAEAVTIAIHNQTDMNVKFDSSGQTIKNGAFRIENENGDTVMWINEKGHVMVKDLRLDNEAFSRNSEFTSSLANMERVSLGKVSISSQLAINEDDFYIYKDGEGGYDLRQYVKDVLSDYNLI